MRRHRTPTLLPSRAGANATADMAAAMATGKTSMQKSTGDSAVREKNNNLRLQGHFLGHASQRSRRNIERNPFLAAKPSPINGQAPKQLTAQICGEPASRASPEQLMRRHRTPTLLPSRAGANATADMAAAMATGKTSMQQSYEESAVREKTNNLRLQGHFLGHASQTGYCLLGSAIEHRRHRCLELFAHELTLIGSFRCAEHRGTPLRGGPDIERNPFLGTDPFANHLPSICKSDFSNGATRTT